MAGAKARNVARPDSRAVAVRSSLPLFRASGAGRIIEWNASAADLSGIPVDEAVGRTCWEVIRGRDARGGFVCHGGCSVVRLAREGWPVNCAALHVRMPSGVECLAISTIVLGRGEDAVVLHPLQVVPAEAEERRPAAVAPELTPRQREVLALLAEGVRAKEIAYRLSLSLPTVRNHIHALLRRLGVRSQLAAAAKAHELGLCDPPSAGIASRR
jgi:DNA-binding CsgD family transcriptional regulator